jgi:hypothetical protein
MCRIIISTRLSTPLSSSRWLKSICLIASGKLILRAVSCSSTYYERHHKRVAGHPLTPAQADELHNFDDLDSDSLADTTDQMATTVSTYVQIDGITATDLVVDKTAPDVTAGRGDEPDFDTRCDFLRLIHRRP